MEYLYCHEYIFRNTYSWYAFLNISLRLSFVSVNPRPTAQKISFSCQKKRANSDSSSTSGSAFSSYMMFTRTYNYLYYLVHIFFVVLSRQCIVGYEPMRKGLRARAHPKQQIDVYTRPIDELGGRKSDVF